MNERPADATLPIAHRYEHDREHDWQALERLADLATRAGHPVAVDDFMWMGAAEFHDGRTVHSYKHVDTRRYLHLDDSGHAYRSLSRAGGGRYVPCESPREAVHFLDPTWTSPLRTSQYPHEMSPEPGRRSQG